MEEDIRSGRTFIGKPQLEIFDTTLIRILGEVISNASSRTLVPPPAKVLNMFKEAGLLRRSVLVKILRLQVMKILQRMRRCKDESHPGPNALTPLATMLSDVLSVWDECRLNPQSLRRSDAHYTQNLNDEICYEPMAVRSHEMEQAQAKDDVCMRLRQWTPRIHSSCIIPMAVTAVVAQSILVSGSMLEDMRTARHLWKRLEILTTRGSIEERHFVDFFEDAEVSEYALATVKGTCETKDLRLTIRKGDETATRFAADQTAMRDEFVSKFQDTDSISIDRIGSEIKSAMSKADTGKTTALWRICMTQIEQGAMRDEAGQEVLCQLTHACFTLRRSDLAIKIYNAIRKSGITPTLGYWRVIFIGCLRDRDAASMAGFWSKMEELGVSADVAMWTARIQTLILGGMWRQGLEALVELCEKWKRDSSRRAQIPDLNAPEFDTPAFTAPISPLSPLKAALSSLRSIDRHELVAKLFTWAKAKLLPIDTITFNILLESRLRNTTDDKDVHAILADMRVHSCKPDLGTYTVILNGILCNASSDFHRKGSNEQTSFLLGMLDQMERQNIIPDERTYSTIFHGLLRGSTSGKGCTDLVAARAVLDRMTLAAASKQVSPSSPIFTSFMTHYFSLHPPDLLAVSSLWNSINASREVRSCLDAVFYDKMIVDYAKIGDVEKMLYFLRTMVNERRSPGYLALLAVLRKLVESREWDAIVKLVRDVEGGPGKGLLRYRQGPTKGKYEFWKLVERCRDEGYLT